MSSTEQKQQTITLSGRVSCEISFEVPAEVFAQYKRGEIHMDEIADYCFRNFEEDNTTVEVCYYDEIQEIVADS